MSEIFYSNEDIELACHSVSGNNYEVVVFLKLKKKEKPISGFL